MTTRKFPRRNLPPDAETWGRDVEGRVQSLENQQDQSLQNGNVNRTLGLISQQINAVEETQQTLATQQQQLAAVVAAQTLTVLSAGNTVGPVAVTTTLTTRITLSIPVPPGSTSVLIIGNADLAFTKAGAGASDNYIESRMVINGLNSTVLNLPSVLLTAGMAINNGGKTGSSFAQFSDVAGVSALTLNYQNASSFSFSVNGTATVTANAIFFRSAVI